MLFEKMPPSVEVSKASSQNKEKSVKDFPSDATSTDNGAIDSLSLAMGNVYLDNVNGILRDSRNHYEEIAVSRGDNNVIGSQRSSISTSSGLGVPLWSSQQTLNPVGTRSKNSQVFDSGVPPSASNRVNNSIAFYGGASSDHSSSALGQTFHDDDQTSGPVRKESIDVLLSQSTSHTLREDLLSVPAVSRPNSVNDGVSGGSLHTESGKSPSSLSTDKWFKPPYASHSVSDISTQSSHMFKTVHSVSSKVEYPMEKLGEKETASSSTSPISVSPTMFSSLQTPQNQQNSQSYDKYSYMARHQQIEQKTVTHMPSNYHADAYTSNHETFNHQTLSTNSNLFSLQTENLHSTSDGDAECPPYWRSHQHHVEYRVTENGEKLSSSAKPSSVGSNLSSLGDGNFQKNPFVASHEYDSYCHKNMNIQHSESVHPSLAQGRVHPPPPSVLAENRFGHSGGHIANNNTQMPSEKRQEMYVRNSDGFNEIGNTMFPIPTYPYENTSPVGSDCISGAPVPVPQQPIMFMAVQMPHRNAPMLQPFQMLQLPNGQHTLVVPSHHPGNAVSGPPPFATADTPSQQQVKRTPSFDQRAGNSCDERNWNNYTKTVTNQATATTSPYSSGPHPHMLNSAATSQVVDNGHKKKDKRSKAKNVNSSKQQDNCYAVENSMQFVKDSGDIALQNEFQLRMVYRDANSSEAIDESTPEAVTALYHSAHRPPLSSLLGHVRRLSRDQVGCRLLQQSLDEDGPEAATSILQEGLPFLAETMTDPFGNYLFQKILEKVSKEERLQLITTVSPRLVNAALNLHGTRSVQKVVEMSVSDNATDTLGYHPAAEVVTRALSSAAARLCIDSHGNHVIQRILQRFPHQYSKFIFDAVANSVGDVARHRHGCCVIQRCLDSPASAARSNLVKRIVEKALDLMQDAYGNYVVQYVLDVCSDEEAAAVCESVIGKVGLLAIQKFSSNVMEKCLERSSDWVQELYLRELSSPDKIRELMADPFGNYVVQRALSVATHSQAICLVEVMRPHLQGMRNTAGGRRIAAKICRRFPNFDINAMNCNNIFHSEQHVHYPPVHHQQVFRHHEGIYTGGYSDGSTPVGVFLVNEPNVNLGENLRMRS